MSFLAALNAANWFPVKDPTPELAAALTAASFSALVAKIITSLACDGSSKYAKSAPMKHRLGIVNSSLIMSNCQ